MKMKAGINKSIKFVKKYKIQISVGLAIFIILLAVLPPRIKKIVAGPQAEYETTVVKQEDIGNFNVEAISIFSLIFFSFCQSSIFFNKFFPAIDEII